PGEATDTGGVAALQGRAEGGDLRAAADKVAYWDAQLVQVAEGGWWGVVVVVVDYLVTPNNIAEVYIPSLYSI
ncbi:hypothetical protein, partial [Candidatus Oscillochloris fontis]|uniref:hypothetical protein n=1 Tax=Candidatus Oscillochloris fontis TaxID=2496868 RepID=UPI001375BFE0